MPSDFIGFARPTDDIVDADAGSMHDLLMSNAAQTKVLAFGKTADGSPPRASTHMWWHTR